MIGVHIQRKFLSSEGHFDTAAANPIARCGYLGDYAEVAQTFQMRRPANNDPQLLQAIREYDQEKKESP